MNTKQSQILPDDYECDGSQPVSMLEFFDQFREALNGYSDGFDEHGGAYLSDSIAYDLLEYYQAHQDDPDDQQNIQDLDHEIRFIFDDEIVRLSVNKIRENLKKWTGEYSKDDGINMAQMGMFGSVVYDF
jgi:hypothetical protein